MWTANAFPLKAAKSSTPSRFTPVAGRRGVDTAIFKLILTKDEGRAATARPAGNAETIVTQREPNKQTKGCEINATAEGWNYLCNVSMAQRSFLWFVVQRGFTPGGGAAETAARVSWAAEVQSVRLPAVCSDCWSSWPAPVLKRQKTGAGHTTTDIYKYVWKYYKWLLFTQH